MPTTFKFSKFNYNEGDCDKGDVVSDPSHLTDHYPAAYKAFFGLLSGALCIFKSGPAWLEPMDSQAQHFIREARPIYGHPIADSWLKSGTDIYKYSGLENRCEATVFEHAVDVTLQGVGMALSACRER